jgi:L-rhamnose mutarotase
MSKVMFTISYEINPEKRDEYLALSQRMKEHLSQANGKNYAIYEQKGKKNNFTEVFVCKSQEEYDQLEDQDEVTTELVGQLEGLLAIGKMKYTTLVELG